LIYTLGDRQPVISENRGFIAPCARIIGSVEIDEDASVWFGAVLRGDNDWIRIGRKANVQDGSILHTDAGIELIVGENVTVGHRVMLHGCEIGDGALIGIGSTILNRARIGRDTLVGAHSLVTEGKTFPDGVLIMGSPAKIVRELEDEERALLRRSAAVYVANSERYGSVLKPLGISATDH
jgi:carbonic anhydrase/acetyltransferase-like protein (isoleucine patch superfamily)